MGALKGLLHQCLLMRCLQLLNIPIMPMHVMTDSPLTWKGSCNAWLELPCLASALFRFTTVAHVQVAQLRRLRAQAYL